jgi:ribonuclease G
MQAAFVDIGLDKAAFLYVGDIRGDINSSELYVDEDERDGSKEGVLPDISAEEPSRGALPPIQDLIKEGQMLLVQVAKDQLGTKGARITTHVSLPGRYLVNMPTLSHIGVSRKIEDEAERNRLKQSIESMTPEGGVIVRTAGEGAPPEELQADLEYLDRLWKDVQQNYDRKKSVGLVHAELDVELRSLRDMLSERVSKVIIDDQKVHKKVLHFVGQFLPRYKDRIHLYKGERPLFDIYDLDLEINRALSRKIWLKSGGYIVFDEAEALVVIDVNTGRFVGKKDLEDTILTTNIEAAREIAHQLRIRSCGGIIIIDFIDMMRESHREQVMSVLKEELAKDKVRTVVSRMSELGLVEMTRKRIRPSLVSGLCDPCPYCEGRGYIKQKVTIAHEILRALERDAERHKGKSASVVRCHGEIADWIYAEEAETLELVESRIGHSLAFKVEPNFHIEQYEVEVY